MEQNGIVIDQIITTLSDDIIKIPLDYINGEEISKGNIQHMTNLIQILTEITRIISYKNSEDKNKSTEIFSNLEIEESPKNNSF